MLKSLLRRQPFLAIDEQFADQVFGGNGDVLPIATLNIVLQHDSVTFQNL
jgi:hypothetical protein